MRSLGVARGVGALGPAIAILLVTGCAARSAVPTAPVPDAVARERCHQAYLTAGSDGPKLLAVDSLIPDSTRVPPIHCGQLRSAHPRLKSSE